MSGAPDKLGAAAMSAALASAADLDASTVLRIALKARGWRYADLAAAIGEKERALRNKVARGNFGANWFLAALRAIDAA